MISFYLNKKTNKQTNPFKPITRTIITQRNNQNRNTKHSLMTEEDSKFNDDDYDGNVKTYSHRVCGGEGLEAYTAAVFKSVLRSPRGRRCG
jgi:hypothetical protein